MEQIKEATEQVLPKEDTITDFLVQAQKSGKKELLGAVQKQGLSSESADLYTALGTTLEQETTAVGITGKLKAAITTPGAKLTAAAVVFTAAVRIADEVVSGKFQPVNLITDLYNSGSQWANYAVTEFNIVPMIIGVGGTVSAVAMFNFITERQTQAAAAGTEKRQSLAAKQETALQEMREGKANLSGRLGPYVAHILSGIEDPSTKPLADTLEQLGIKSILFWDERNPLFSKGHYKNWLAVGDDGWTSRKVLEKSSPRETVVSFGQLTLGQEAFLEQKEPNADYTYPEEMTFAEASGYRYALKEIREKEHLPNVFQVLLTSPDREILGSVGASKSDVYGTDTIGKIIDSREQAIVDLDKSVLIEIAEQNSQNLPIEIYNGPDTNDKYPPRLLEAIIKHNRRCLEYSKLPADEQRKLRPGELRPLKFIIRDETPEIQREMEKYDKSLADGSVVITKGTADTYTLFYALDDDKTIFLANTKFEKATRNGSAVVVISDPERLNRLSSPIKKSGKYICVGTIATDAEIDQFLKALAEEKISMPPEFYENLKRRVSEGLIDKELVDKLKKYELI